jgi:hypothetical protein
MDDEDTFIMSRSTAALVMGGIFGGAGALAGAPSARLSIAPFVTRRAKGVALSFAF